MSQGGGGGGTSKERTYLFEIHEISGILEGRFDGIQGQLGVKKGLKSNWWSIGSNRRGRTSSAKSDPGEGNLTKDRSLRREKK